MPHHLFALRNSTFSHFSLWSWAWVAGHGFQLPLLARVSLFKKLTEADDTKLMNFFFPLTTCDPNKKKKKRLNSSLIRGCQADPIQSKVNLRQFHRNYCVKLQIRRAATTIESYAGSWLINQTFNKSTKSKHKRTENNNVKVPALRWLIRF